MCTAPERKITKNLTIEASLLDKCASFAAEDELRRFHYRGTASASKVIRTGMRVFFALPVRERERLLEEINID